MNRALSLQILTLFISILLQGQNGAGNWMYAGPGQTAEQVKGMIKSLWVDENNSSFVLAGSSSGGLFKCENANESIPQWQNISDTYQGMNFGITDIVVIPGTNNKRIFVSTGHNSGIPLGYGNGILETTDGGLTWQEVGPKGKRRNLFMIDGLVANRQNASEMIAYTRKELFITRNAWQSYTRVLVPVDSTNDNISICDVEFAPFEAGKFYVCTRTYNFYDARLFVCSNYGITIVDNTPGEKQSERIDVETINAPSYKGKFYAAYGNSNVYVSYYNGNVFKTLNAAPVNQVFAGAFWNLEFTVNPRDTAIMYIAMTEVSASSNGGKSFDKISGYNGHNTHADVRALFLCKNAGTGNNKLFAGNDGGISMLESITPAVWKSLNGKGLDANQFWGADIAQSDTLLIAGGAQDNGSFLVTGKNAGNNMASCGDGYLGLVIDEHSAITQCNPPSLYYNDLKTQQAFYLSVNDNKYETRRPMAQTDSFVYLAHHNVWRVKKSDLKKGNTSFSKVSDLPELLYESKGVRNGSIKAMSIAADGACVIAYSNPNWTEKENIGKVFFCGNINAGNTAWTDITSLLNYRTMVFCRWFEIYSIEINPFNSNKFCLVAKNPFDQTNSLLYEVIYEPDSNTCFINQINRNLPQLGINKINTDKFSGVTYLACDDGVYYSHLENDTTWRRLEGTNKLPRVPVSDIAFNYATNTILAATYGRGLWQSTLVSYPQNTSIRKNEIRESPFKVDGKLVVTKKTQLSLNNKVIITSGSVIELRKGSTLSVKRALVRDENNKLIDLDVIVHKNKGARIIYR